FIARFGSFLDPRSVWKPVLAAFQRGRLRFSFTEVQAKFTRSRTIRLSRKQLFVGPSAEATRDYLNRYAPILKHKSFEEEREWRIISRPLMCALELQFITGQCGELHRDLDAADCLSLSFTSRERGCSSDLNRIKLAWDQRMDWLILK